MTDLDPAKFFEYLPAILQQLTTAEQIFGLVVLLFPFIFLIASKGMKPQNRGIGALVFMFGIMGFLYLMLQPRAAQLADEVVPGSEAIDPDAPTLPSTTEAGLLFPNSSTERLSRSDLEGLSPKELTIARNEIFARNGRFFRTQSLTDHFEQFDWYRPTTWEPTLTAVEQANVDLIRSVEGK